MTPVARLKEVIEGMDFQNEEISAYWNKKSGEIISIMSESLQAAEENESLEDYPEWQHEDINEAREFLASPDDYIPLPSKFDIHEWEIMERFCLEIDDLHVRDAMLDSLRGGGAFRRFKNNVERYNIQKDWYPFREKALREIAIEWCEEHKIEFIE